MSGEASRQELAETSRRMWIGGLLTLPVVLLVFGADFGEIPQGVLGWIQFAFATPVVLWAGWPLFRRGAQSIRRGAFDMFTLVALGAGTAWLYSVAAAVFARPVYFESAAVIVVLVLIGQVLEMRARAATSNAVKHLEALLPRTALRVRDGTDEEIALDAVAVGDSLRVRAGDTVPVDGVVSDGSGEVDESMITGDTAPVIKQLSDRVVGGTVNRNGSFVVIAEKVGRDTTLARIVGLVAEAQHGRPPRLRGVDIVAGRFVPLVLLAAGVAAAGWWLGGAALQQALMAAVAVLIVGCPCALGLATPIAIMVAVRRAAAAGLVIRDVQALQQLAKIDTLVIDKTGTLTGGRPEIMEVTGGLQTLRLAAALEQGNPHPIGRAILDFVRERNLAPATARDLQMHPGQGLSGTVDGKRVVLGNAQLLKEQGVDLGRFERPVMLAVDGKLTGTMRIDDPLRPTAAPAVAWLREQAMQVVMLTGDSRQSAERIAKQLDLSKVEAELLPEDKVKVVERLRGLGHVVAVAGDGVNDAPALAAADVGIAMGTGTEIAIESAGVTLVQGDLLGIVRAIELARATTGIVRQNLFFAFAYNALAVPIAAGALHSAGMTLSPVLAAAAMALSTLSVTANALRLRQLRLP